METPKKVTKRLKYKKIGERMCIVTGKKLFSFGRHIVIPEEAYVDCQMCRVVGIGYRAFRDKGGIRSVSCPSGIEVIGDEAFSGCIRLSDVTLSEGIQSISAKAFDGCTALTSVTLPETVTNIGHAAFNNCKKLERIVIPAFGRGASDAMAPDAFHGCDSLRAIEYKGHARTMILVPSADQGLSLPPEDWRDGVLYEDNWVALFDGPRDHDFLIDRHTVGIAPDAMAALESVKFTGGGTAASAVELTYPLSRADWDQIEKPKGNFSYRVRVNTADGTFETVI